MPRPPRRVRTTLAGSVLVALTASLAVTGVPADATPAATPRPSALPLVRSAGDPVTPSSSHRVTLITGDVVTVSPVAGGGSTVSVDLADPRSSYRTQTVGDDLYVIPDAALPYLASHRLDRALFDVTGLIAQGYDDASTKTLPLIARYADLWNTRGTPDQLAAHDARLRTCCEAIGRDPESIERTVFQNVVIRPTRAAALDAWDGYRLRHRPQEGEDRPEVVGSVDEVGASLREYASVGFRHAIWVFRSPFDIATMDALSDIRARTEGA